MPTASLVDATVEGVPTPSLPMHIGKPDYAAIKETHQLLTAKSASVKCKLGGGQNSYLRLILPPERLRHRLCAPTWPGKNDTRPSMGTNQVI